MEPPIDEPRPAGAPPVNQTIRLLTLMLALSLALHAATIYTLYQARSAAREQALALADELSAAQDGSLSLSVPLRLPVPIEAEVPIHKTVTVPIDTTIPLDTTFKVPLKTPFGTYDVPVPIKADVPVRFEAPVTIDDTVTVSTTVRLDTQLPLEIPVRETPLAEYLERLRRGLLELAEHL